MPLAKFKLHKKNWEVRTWDINSYNNKHQPHGLTHQASKMDWTWEVRTTWSKRPNKLRKKKQGRLLKKRLAKQKTNKSTKLRLVHLALWTIGIIICFARKQIHSKAWGKEALHCERAEVSHSSTSPKTKLVPWLDQVIDEK